MAQIKVTDLTFAYPGSYDTIFEHTSFQIDTDWKLGFIGRNGRGKTTFLRLLMGEYPYQGRIDAPTAFDYFPFPVPHPAWLAGEAAEEIAPEVPRWRLARELAALGLGEDVLWRPFDTLSKGEQTKLLLALLFLRENGFPTAAWTTSCRSTARISRCSAGIFPPGGKTGSGGTPLSWRRTRD